MRVYTVVTNHVKHALHNTHTHVHFTTAMDMGTINLNLTIT